MSKNEFFDEMLFFVVFKAISHLSRIEQTLISSRFVPSFEKFTIELR